MDPRLNGVLRMPGGGMVLQYSPPHALAYQDNAGEWTPSRSSGLLVALEPDARGGVTARIVGMKGMEGPDRSGDRWEIEANWADRQVRNATPGDVARMVESIAAATMSYHMVTGLREDGSSHDFELSKPLFTDQFDAERKRRQDEAMRIDRDREWNGGMAMGTPG